LLSDQRRTSTVTDFLLTSHIRGEKLILRVRDLSAETLHTALERLGEYFAENLERPHDELWGVRIVSRAGIFEFGDWSFDRLAGRGGALSANEGALTIFRRWEEEARCDPAVALAATAELVRHGMVDESHSGRARHRASAGGRIRGARCARGSIGMH
jgi:hypothetical protein